MSFWWQKDENELGSAVADIIYKLKEDHYGRFTMNLDMLRMYTQRDYEALDRFNPEARAMNLRAEDFRMRLNVIGNMVDTLTSRIGKSKPRPMYLTKRGDYKLRQKARLLGDMMEGVFHQTNLFRLMPNVFMDSCIFDIAALKVGRDGQDLFTERVFPNELVWDIDSAMYSGMPPALHQIKSMPMETLIMMYPEVESDIRFMAEQISNYDGEEGREADMLEVIESWHLPSVMGGDDGLHCITMQELVLSSEQYDYDRYPFVFLKWGEAGIGFAGISLAEQLKNVQFEINKLCLRIQQAMHLLSVPWVFVQAGSRVVDSHLRNVPGSIISYVGQPPVTYTPQAMHPEVYAHLDRLFQRAYEIAGVSELSATGKKPAGLESGAALRAYHDIETERFISVAQRYENAFMDAAQWFMDLAQEIVAESGSFPVNGIAHRTMRTIDFKDIKMAEKDYILQPYPVSLLPSTPAGRLQAVSELVNNQIITDPGQIVRLLDFPDLQSVTSLVETQENDVDWRIQEIEDNGIYHGPEPVMNLQYASQRMIQAYLEGQQDGMELDKLNLMLLFIDECQQLMQQQPNVAQAPAAPGEQPAQLPESPQAEGGQTPPSMADIMGGAPATPPAESLPA